MTRFDAVAFDLFGTLIDEWTVEQWRECLDGMAGALGMPEEDFGDAWRATAEPRLTGGYGSIRENLQVIHPDTAAAALDEAVARRQAVMAAMVRPRPDVEATLWQLRERGLRTALVSMCSPEVPGLWRALPAAGLIDVEVFSSEDGLRKPDPAIYALAAQRLGVPAERVLYVGDGSFGELTGAVAAGMTAVRIRAAHEAELVIQRAEEDVDWSGPSVATIEEVLTHL